MSSNEVYDTQTMIFFLMLDHQDITLVYTFDTFDAITLFILSHAVTVFEVMIW